MNELLHYPMSSEAKERGFAWSERVQRWMTEKSTSREPLLLVREWDWVTFETDARRLQQQFKWWSGVRTFWVQRWGFGDVLTPWPHPPKGSDTDWRLADELSKLNKRVGAFPIRQERVVWTRHALGAMAFQPVHVVVLDESSGSSQEKVEMSWVSRPYLSLQKSDRARLDVFRRGLGEKFLSEKDRQGLRRRVADVLESDRQAYPPAL